jgi:hypothetical protein
MLIDFGSKEDWKGITLLNKILLKTEISSSREKRFVEVGAKGF